MQPIVQISLDVTTIQEALDTAAMALRAGVDWLGRRDAPDPCRRAPRRACAACGLSRSSTGGGSQNNGRGLPGSGMMAQAGATHVVVMARAHEETIGRVVEAGADYGLKVMGDNLGCPDKVAAARRLEALGCDYVIHHIGYDDRRAADH